jgi:hypothetical protein
MGQDFDEYIDFTLQFIIPLLQRVGAAKGILRLPHRWQRVVNNAGDYIEGQ